jgi:hypothetical protein
MSASAERKYARYSARAHEAFSRGDKVAMENLYQHAEHYFRVMRADNECQESMAGHARADEEAINVNNAQTFDYKTHILIACTSVGKMRVVCHWPHLPRQAEVEREMDGSKEGHTTFLLCTPTSVLPVKADGQSTQRSPARLK